jgi:hypothetical protein
MLATGATMPSAVESRRIGREYVKKIFQVTYGLPAVVPEQLDSLLESMYQEAQLESGQLGDLRGRVAPYIRYITAGRPVNPREIKRFVNSYVLQTLVRAELDKNTVLALQTIEFRFDWQALHDAILANSSLFLNALRRYRQGDDEAFEDLSPDLRELPPSLASYLRSSAVKPLLEHDSLRIYLSSLQRISSAGLWLYDAARQIDQLCKAIEALIASGSMTRSSGEPIATKAVEVAESIDTQIASSVLAEESIRLASTLERVRTLSRDMTDVTAGSNDEELNPLITELLASAEDVRRELRILRESPAIGTKIGDLLESEVTVGQHEAENAGPGD